MKNKRNCQMPYPMYPMNGMPNMMPGVPIMPNQNMNYDMNNNFEQRINNLEKRVSALEAALNNSYSNNYNSSNYQML